MSELKSQLRSQSERTCYTYCRPGLTLPQSKAKKGNEQRLVLFRTTGLTDTHTHTHRPTCIIIINNTAPRPRLNSRKDRKNDQTIARVMRSFRECGCSGRPLMHPAFEIEYYFTQPRLHPLYPPPSSPLSILRRRVGRSVVCAIELKTAAYVNDVGAYLPTHAARKKRR